MSARDHLFIHPLLASDQSHAGYLCVHTPDTDPAARVQQLIEAALWPQFPSRLPWFVPATLACASQTRLTAVFDAVPGDEAGQALRARLRQAGSRTAVRLQPGQPLPVAGDWDDLLLRCSHARSLPPLSLSILATHSRLVLLEVSCHADHEWLKKGGLPLGTDEYLLTSQNGRHTADTARSHLLHLLSLIAEDASTGELEAIFRQEPKLAYALLRLVNSAAVAPRVPITCFGQAINLLGRRQLQRWLQLLVYADPDNGQRPNPLLQKAAARGQLLALLSEGLSLPAELEHPADAAFMVGSFSLLDVLLHRPLPDILEELTLAPAVHQALAEQGGVLGQLLAALQLAERGRHGEASERLTGLGIEPDDHLQAQLATLYWARSIQPD